MKVAQASEVQLELMYILGQSLRRNWLKNDIKQDSVCSIEKLKLSSQDKMDFLL